MVVTKTLYKDYIATKLMWLKKNNKLCLLIQNEEKRKCKRHRTYRKQVSLNNWIQIIQWVTQNLNRLHIPFKDNDVK